MSKIALVDDDRNILTSVSMTLEAEGFEAYPPQGYDRSKDLERDEVVRREVNDIENKKVMGTERLLEKFESSAETDDATRARARWQEAFLVY